ncbi:hypothetical protein TIFTF001_001854 [Ficus carica]|uniref:Uncharacterized protein n=1 Tax=Ficus carica TaxID=3494 RepID=A0AA88CS09_FICCA|nr:hypothetical protein TIFTF001_001854 [Ficus carica]
MLFGSGLELGKIETGLGGEWDGGARVGVEIDTKVKVGTRLSKGQGRAGNGIRAKLTLRSRLGLELVGTMVDAELCKVENLDQG